VATVAVGAGAAEGEDVCCCCCEPACDCDCDCEAVWGAVAGTGAVAEVVGAGVVGVVPAVCAWVACWGTVVGAGWEEEATGADCVAAGAPVAAGVSVRVGVVLVLEGAEGACGCDDAFGAGAAAGWDCGVVGCG
jgi:hypothetical protein